MNKRLCAILAAFACACALCFSLVGCGGSAEDRLVGTWKVVEMTDGDNGDMSDMLDVLENSGLAVTLTLRGDQTATFDMAGSNTMEGTWEKESDTEASITFDGYSATTASIDDDGRLNFEEDGSTLTCEKQETEG